MGGRGDEPSPYMPLGVIKIIPMRLRRPNQRETNEPAPGWGRFFWNDVSTARSSFHDQDHRLIFQDRLLPRVIPHQPPSRASRGFVRVSLIEAYVAALPLTAVAIVSSADGRQCRIETGGTSTPAFYFKPSHAELVLSAIDLDGWTEQSGGRPGCANRTGGRELGAPDARRAP